MGISRARLPSEQRCLQGKDHGFGIVFCAVAWWHAHVLLEGAELCWEGSSAEPVAHPVVGTVPRGAQQGSCLWSKLNTCLVPVPGKGCSSSRSEGMHGGLRSWVLLCCQHLLHSGTLPPSLPLGALSPSLPTWGGNGGLGRAMGHALLPPVCSHLLSPPCCWCGCGTGVVREPLLAPLSFIVCPVARVTAKHKPWEPCS